MRHRFEQARETDELWEEKLKELQERIGYRFSDLDLLRTALTHSSYRHEMGLESDNERLEFIGDSVLQLLVTEELVNRYPLAGEGELTRRRSVLVCEETLQSLERGLGLFDYLRLGKGVGKQAGKGTQSIRADAMEALIGAIYQDGGLLEAQRFFSPVLLSQAGIAVSELRSDPKSALQERFQQSGKTVPEYVLLEKSGQDDVPNFVVGILSDGEVLATGSGHSKKEAEFAAAKKAFENLP